MTQARTDDRLAVENFQKKEVPLDYSDAYVLHFNGTDPEIVLRVGKEYIARNELGIRVSPAHNEGYDIELFSVDSGSGMRPIKIKLRHDGRAVVDVAGSHLEVEAGSHG